MIKLPPWFKVQTPLGTYNPDWAIVKQVSEDEQNLYLIRQHFDVLNVDFDVVTDASQV